MERQLGGVKDSAQATGTIVRMLQQQVKTLQACVEDAENRRNNARILPERAEGSNPEFFAE